MQSYSTMTQPEADMVQILMPGVNTRLSAVVLNEGALANFQKGLKMT